MLLNRICSVGEILEDSGSGGHVLVRSVLLVTAGGGLAFRLAELKGELMMDTTSNIHNAPLVAERICVFVCL